MTKFTADNYLEISMPPGKYRFCVIPYDILDKPATGTQWAAFKVYNAVRPELYKTEELNYYNDKNGSKFEFFGNNIEPDAQIYFVASDGERVAPVEIIGNEDGNSVRLVFDKGQLIDGEYEIIVINPGGLDTSMSGIDYRAYREKFGIAHYVAGVSFMQAYPSYGEGLSSGGYLYYLSAHISFISCMFLDNYIGFELTLSRFTKFWEHFYYTDQTNGYRFGYNLIFINWISGRQAAVNFRIGAGFDLQPMDLSYFNIGVSFQYRIFQKFYVEAGVNFSNSIIDSTIGDFMPWIGLTTVF